MALRYPLLVAILSDKKHAVWNLQWLQQGRNQPDIQVDTNVKVQFKSVDCYSDGSGFSMGLIEGRCAMKKINPTSYKAENDFTFKCHRDNTSQSAFAVNSIAFNQAHGTFATGGSDSSVIFWDRFAKQCLKTFTGLDGPVTAMDFKVDGSLFAYATGYDWAKGPEGAGSVVPKISYRVSTDDSKPKQAFK
jgi:mRNA export factor